jgi:hypothetical protein
MTPLRFVVRRQLRSNYTGHVVIRQVAVHSAATNEDNQTTVKIEHTFNSRPRSISARDWKDYRLLR